MGATQGTGDRAIRSVEEEAEEQGMRHEQLFTQIPKELVGFGQFCKSVDDEFRALRKWQTAANETLGLALGLREEVARLAR